MLNLNYYENELKKCLSYMDNYWEKQNNEYDKATNFIYNCNSIDEVIERCEQNNFSVNLHNYAFHRWYNYITSSICESFCCIPTNNGPIVRQALNRKDHNVDIYIDDVPYDVKLSVFPRKLYNENSKLIYSNFTDQEDKNELIKWLYENQSREKRNQESINRLYIVLKGNNSLTMKSDLHNLKNKITNYFDTFIPNELELLNGYKVYSDIIFIEDEN